MFANCSWYAELIFFCFATFPPVSHDAAVSKQVTSCPSALPPKWSVAPWKGSAPRYCALDMCNTAKNFSHQASMYATNNCALLTPGFSVSSFHQFHHHTHLVPFFGFWFLVYYAATQLATPLHQRRIQVMRSNKVAQKRLIESNGTPAMNFGCEEIRKRRYTQTKNRTQHKNTVVI
jgi:hypothetical protein